MLDKRPYLFKSLLFLYVCLVLLSNFVGLLQQRESPTTESNDAFLESISKIDNEGDIGEIPDDKHSLVVTFGLSDQLKATMRHYSSNSLATGLKFLSYPLLGNDDTESFAERHCLQQLKIAGQRYFFWLIKNGAI